MNIICFGAHPDDCEFFAGGTAVKWVQRGDKVCFVSLTNGDKGHHEMSPEALAERRRKESKMSAAIAEVESVILDCHDGELCPTLELRRKVVDLIRTFEAEVVLTHRPNDYHPDHRYTSQLVQDAAFVVTVPLFSPLTPRREKNPVFLYFQDLFEKPNPFSPDVAVAIDDVLDKKWAMLDAIESQVYEWLPWLENKLGEVPQDQSERLNWLKKTWEPFFMEATRRSRITLHDRYGNERGDRVYLAEAFEVCEYGRVPDRKELYAIFPE